MLHSKLIPLMLIGYCEGGCCVVSCTEYIVGMSYLSYSLFLSLSLSFSLLLSLSFSFFPRAFVGVPIIDSSRTAFESDDQDIDS